MFNQWVKRISARYEADATFDLAPGSIGTRIVGDVISLSTLRGDRFSIGKSGERWQWPL